MQVGLTQLIATDLSLEDLFKHASEAGYDAIELALRNEGELTPDTPANELQGSVRRAREAGLSLVSMCHSHVTGNLLGGGDTRQVGLSLPGAPFMAVGTNGEVAWCQTQFFGDITDWYREELVLDSEGMPSASMFDGAERDLVRVDEEYEVADIDGLGSEGRTETWPRFETFDGRMITSIEGEEVDADASPGAGESVVNLLGDYVIPKDMDGDGVISAVSFDYTGLEGPNFARTLDQWGHASTVREMYDASGWLVAYSQNIAAADKDGSVMYTGYQVMPCREHLRAGDGTWADGANPGRLIDGTQYPGFDLPLTEDGEVDEAAGEGDPNGCVVPLDEYPAAIDPSEGYVVTANNAPGTMGVDNDLENDPWYIGGPWHEDFRATRIAEMIEAQAGSVDEDAVAAMQADVRSPLGALFVPYILESIEAARTAAGGSPADGTPEARLKALYDDNSADLDELETRLMAWQDAGYRARSGVETFYNSPDAQDRSDAVATTLFNAWLGPFVRMTLDDEKFQGRIYHPTGSGGRARVLKRMIEGRGADNPLSMPSWNPATEESAFFDVLSTSPIETSEEVAVMAAVDALAFLRSDGDGEGGGGFGNDDWDSWLWGLRHHTRFDSLLADFLEGDEDFGFLVDMFSITTEQLPLADSLPDDDPRAVLSGFPRGGDNFVVDAANPGYSGTDFTFGSIPVFRMVIALRGDETTGRNVLPGGQSALPDSEHYSDQAALWLANDTTPMRLTPTQVAAGATHLDTFRSSGT
ncbi:MAG: penicillin acylase family protein [Polyangiales bacterium]